jgi:V/A-type H+/Na+-transporting ATPase subunit I
MIQKMASVLVAGPKNEFGSIVDVLFHAGTVHLEEVSEFLPPGTTTVRTLKPEHKSEISTLLATIAGILLLAPEVSVDPAHRATLYEDIHHMATADLIQKASDVVGQVETTIRDLATRKSELEIAINGLDRYEKIIDKIQPLEQQLPILSGFEVTVLILQKEFADVLEIIRPALSELTEKQYELISAEIDADTIAAITVFNKKYSEQVHRFLFSKNINEVRIPADYSNMPLEKALLLIDENRRKALAGKAAIDSELRRFSESWYPDLVVIRDVLAERDEELQAYNKFGETEYTVIIRGWIPKKFLKKTRKTLEDTFGGRVVMTETDATAEMMDRAPVFYDNPRWVRPFEFFMQLASPPKYYEIDPSPIMAIFFPIFFGLIVGDIGYGLLILAFGIFLRYWFRELKWLHQISGILIISSIPAIFFGYIFGEFFGNFGEMMGWLQPVTLFGITWNRMEAIVPLLIVTIAIGVVHVVLGLVIGVVNGITRKNRKHVCEKCGMLGLIAALLILLGVVINILPSSLFVPAFVFMGIAVILIIYGGGTLGAIEIMSTVGNILSYARLMAIGLASVILAMVANMLGGAMEVVIVGVLIAVLLHALNLILAMFSPSIHSVRLHVVEFFSKFYEGGGIPYSPFGMGKMAEKK